MDRQNHLQELVDKVSNTKKYQAINPQLVKHLVKKAVAKGLKEKEVIKEVRGKLHQVGGAYLRHHQDYDTSKQELSQLPADLTSEELKQFCVNTMQLHASTNERLTIVQDFFEVCLESIAPLTKILDLACGLNPLALPWMPTAQDFTYDCCDIYQDMMAFLQIFFNHCQVNSQAHLCNLVSDLPGGDFQITFLLKSIPCLEQLEKDITLRLLEELNSSHILVSFPVHSLSGQNKGMPNFYRDNFYQLLKNKPWEIQEFSFSSELAFLISK